MHLVIDADQMIYAAGFATEKEPEHYAFNIINKRIQKTIDLTKATSYEVFIKGEGNFRDSISMDYKAQRSAEKPKHYKAIVNFLKDVHEASPVDGMEADDMVSLLLYKDFEEHNGDKDLCKVIVSSADKDLKNTPGWHFNPMKDTLDFYTEEQCTRHFCYQMLVGDTADNIKGVNSSVTHRFAKKHLMPTIGVGDKGARAILKGLTAQESLQKVGEVYANAGYDDVYMEQQCNLLWMARHMDSLDRTPLRGWHYLNFDLLEGYDRECQALYSK